jgi:hypothetical protein
MTQEQVTNKITLILFQSLFNDTCIGHDEDGNAVVVMKDSDDPIGAKISNESIVLALRTIADQIEKG